MRRKIIRITEERERERDREEISKVCYSWMREGGREKLDNKGVGEVKVE